MSDTRIPTGIIRDARLRAVSEATGLPFASVLAAAVAIVCEGVSRAEGERISASALEALGFSLDIADDDWRRLLPALEGLVLEDGRLVDRAAWVWRGGWQIDVPADRWAEIRAEIFARDDYRCSYCGTRGRRLECDHITPLSRGGRTTPDNLTTACLPCNRSKGRRTLEEWKC